MDQKVYIDLGFYRELKDVSTRLATSPKPMSSRTRSAITCRICWASSTRWSVKQRMAEPEQCPSGPRRAAGRLLRRGVGQHAERGARTLRARRYRSALNAASAIGDDRMQKQSQGYVVPDSFTHGPQNSGCAGSSAGCDRQCEAVRHVQGGRALARTRRPRRPSPRTACLLFLNRPQACMASAALEKGPAISRHFLSDAIQRRGATEARQPGLRSVCVRLLV